MAFKLTIDIGDDGQLSTTHEGQIDPVFFLGCLESIKHSLLMEITDMVKPKETK
jgi:hypothetical protein